MRISGESRPWRSRHRLIFTSRSIHWFPLTVLRCLTRIIREKWSDRRFLV
jgi:hypothetical protein